MTLLKQKETHINLYRSLIIVWLSYYFRKVQSHLSPAIRTILEFVYSFVPHHSHYWSSCDTRKKVAEFRYWNRLIDMDDSRLQKIVFKWDVDLDFINSCSKSIESLFIKLDLSAKFLN